MLRKPITNACCCCHLGQSSAGDGNFGISPLDGMQPAAIQDIIRDGTSFLLDVSGRSDQLSKLLDNFFLTFASGA